MKSNPVDSLPAELSDDLDSFHDQPQYGLRHTLHRHQYISCLGTLPYALLRSMHPRLLFHSPRSSYIPAVVLSCLNLLSCFWSLSLEICIIVQLGLLSLLNAYFSLFLLTPSCTFSWLLSVPALLRWFIAAIFSSRSTATPLCYLNFALHFYLCSELCDLLLIFSFPSFKPSNLRYFYLHYLIFSHVQNKQSELAHNITFLNNFTVIDVLCFTSPTIDLTDCFTNS